MTQDAALDILKTGANVFLTGEPGSGKTHTVNKYIAWLRERGVEPSITASTGIAATHVGGYTIHSWSGIGIKRGLSAYELDAIATNKNVYKRVREACVLVIDEVSMLADTTLSMVDAVCREIRHDRRPFGGLQVVLVGDFFQLPPVVKNGDRDGEPEMFVDDDEKSPFSFNSSAWETLGPLVCYLHEQHRQEYDAFLDLLSAIRRGEGGERERALLRTRYSRTASEGTTQLFSHNADVDMINSAALSKLSGDVRRFEMTSSGRDKLVAHLKRGCLSPETLSLKIGARVMFTKNDAFKHRYVNGTLGTVTSFGGEAGYPIVDMHNGGSILAEPDEWSVQDGGRVLAQIEQIPLRLAWAMTVHKSQGMSLDAAHMDLSNTFEYGQGYVALSRVRTLAGLSIAGLNTRALEVHPEILEKDEEFRAQSGQAEEAFTKLPAEELANMHKNFIKACDGHEPVAGQVQSKPVSLEKSPLEKIREKFPNAYRPWSDEDDENLTTRFTDGEKMPALVKVFGRKRGAVRSRLIKLGLIEEDGESGDEDTVVS